MSTLDVPGGNPVNNDVLKLGCWAEHADGSLIFVYALEPLDAANPNAAKKVIYTMFDVSKDPPVEYRDAMPEASFKKTFSYSDKPDPTKKQNEKWIWHDKTPFPWDRVIKAGFTDGQKIASADGIRTAAERVAESLKLHGSSVSRDLGHLKERTEVKVRGMWDRIKGAVNELTK